jgi:hypothetical protein
MNAIRTNIENESSQNSTLTSLNPLADQIRVLREYFPKASYDHRFLEAAVPEEANGLGAVMRESALSPTYAGAIKELFMKLSYQRGFTNYEARMLDQSDVRLNSRTEKFIRTIEAEQQGEILILPVYVGWKFLAKAPIDKKWEFLQTTNKEKVKKHAEEFGLDPIMLGSLLLTHPDLLLSGGTWIDCIGGEARLLPKSDYDYTPFFSPTDTNGISFGVRLSDQPNFNIEDESENCRTATGFLPHL